MFTESEPHNSPSLKTSLSFKLLIKHHIVIRPTWFERDENNWWILTLNRVKKGKTVFKRTASFHLVLSKNKQSIIHSPHIDHCSSNLSWSWCDREDDDNGDVPKPRSLLIAPHRRCSYPSLHRSLRLLHDHPILSVSPLFLISDFESIWSHSNFSVFDSVAKRDFLDEVTALVSIILFPSIDVFFKVYSFLTLFLIQSFNSDGNHLNLLPRVKKLSLVSSPQIFPRLLINLFVSIAL